MKTRWLLLALTVPLLAACGIEGAGQTRAIQVLAQGAEGDAGPASAEQVAQAAALTRSPAVELASTKVEYPLDESVFPPDFIQPTVVWKDATPGVDAWVIDFDLGKEAAGVRIFVPGPPPPIGEIDERAVAPTNKLPERPAPDVRSWRPDDATWASLKTATREQWADVTITGFGRDAPSQPLSRGQFRFMTSKDPVGAPIFYRDVPLAPIRTKKGRIKPLADEAVDLIRWRLRDVSKPESRVVLEGMPTCANCHSFSQDGSTFAMDIDSPEGDKGTYGIVPVREQMEIDYGDIITWNDFPGKTEGLNTFGFLSRISPNGRYAVSTVNESLFVANYTNYGFLQAFYPTRGIFAWLDTETGDIQALPGGDDTEYVHCTPVWTPDGKDIIFSRATARAPYEEDKPLPEYPNDPNEPEIRYDIYRMPFNEGRGGTPVPIEGASANGMSNTFPKVSPDGKWIVYTKCRNGLLMRPDGRLWIVPTEGGEAREMRANSWRMNSWHSWSPNSRWLVFSSKAYSPYTQLLLTHVDEDGNDTPHILIPNSTAANRAVNIPEFVNAPYESIQSIDVPGVRHRRDMRRGDDLLKEGKIREALSFFRRAVDANPDHAGAHVSLGRALGLTGKVPEAIREFQTGMRLDPTEPLAHLNLGPAMLELGRIDDSIRHTEKYLELSWNDPSALQNIPKAKRNLAFAHIRKGNLERAREALTALLEDDPNDLELHRNLGLVALRQGKPADAIPHLQRVVHWEPNDLGVTNALAWQLATAPDVAIRNGARAVSLAERLAKATSRQNAGFLDTLAAAYAEAGRLEEAIATAEEALQLEPEGRLKADLLVRLALYRKGEPFRYPRPH